MKKTSVVIIGSGIAGISASLYLKRANIDFILLEGNMAGGMLNQLKTIENYPAVPKTSGSDILISLMDQLRFNNIPVTYGNVQTILKNETGFEVVTDVNSMESKVVIVATGTGTTSKTIVGEDKYFGLGVSYCATCDGNFFKGADVAVIGNNNICIEEASYLSGLVNKLYFVCPDEELSGDKDGIDNLKRHGNIEIIKSAEVTEIIGDDFGVTGIVVDDKVISVSGVFPYVGKKTPTQILKNIKPIMNGPFVITNEEKMTNISGLYAAGDIVSKKLKQLITAASDGATAATAAINYLKLK